MLWTQDPVCLHVWLNAKEGICDDGPFQPYHKQQIASPLTDIVMPNIWGQPAPLLWTAKTHVAGEKREVKRHGWWQMIVAAAPSLQSTQGGDKKGILRERRSRLRTNMIFSSSNHCRFKLCSCCHTVEPWNLSLPQDAASPLFVHHKVTTTTWPSGMPRTAASPPAFLPYLTFTHFNCYFFTHERSLKNKICSPTPCVSVWLCSAIRVRLQSCNLILGK